MERIWIIGCGRFGKIALERLSDENSSRRLRVVDSNPAQLPAACPPGVNITAEDGVLFLKRALARDQAPDWIVPALPVHLAAEWCLGRYPGGRVIRRCSPPEGLECKLPNFMRGVSGDLYVSRASFYCPDDCPEPAGWCPLTGEERMENMFDRIRQVKVSGFDTIVVQSRQLAPGVGGCRPGDLFRVSRRLAENDGKFLVATACRCHGVITPVEACADPEG